MTPQHNKRKAARVWAILSLLFLLLPHLVSAGGKKPGRFQLEFYGGFSTLGLDDFNAIVDYDNQVEHLLYDMYYQYLQDIGQVSSWTRESDGDRLPIENAFPMGGRLRYRLSSSFSISLGFKHLSAKNSSDFSIRYQNTDNYGYSYIDNKEYFPYSMSVSAMAPLLGVHWEKRLGLSLGLEVYLAGGPLSAECRYQSAWESHWLYQYGDYNSLLYEGKGTLEQQGKGKGYVLELGGRLNVALGRTVGLFLEAGYAFQRATGISGPGMETRDGHTRVWEGEWGMVEEEITTGWGGLIRHLPTNYLENWPDSRYLKDFVLDFSGFQVRIGLSLRF